MIQYLTIPNISEQYNLTTMEDCLHERLNKSLSLLNLMKSKNQRLIFINSAEANCTNLTKDRQNIEHLIPVNKSLTCEGEEQAKALYPYCSKLFDNKQKTIITVSPSASARRTAQWGFCIKEIYMVVNNKLKEKYDSESDVEMLVRMLKFIQDVLVDENCIIVAFSHYHLIKQLLDFLNIDIQINPTSHCEIFFDSENMDIYCNKLKQITENIPNVNDIISEVPKEFAGWTQILCKYKENLMFVKGPHTYHKISILLPETFKATFCTCLAFLTSFHDVNICGWFDKTDDLMISYTMLINDFINFPHEKISKIYEFLEKQFGSKITINDNCVGNSAIFLDSKIQQIDTISKNNELKYDKVTMYSFDQSEVNIDNGNFGHIIVPNITICTTPDTTINKFVDEICEFGILSHKTNATFETFGRMGMIKFIYY